jgi:maleate isomerase
MRTRIGLLVPAGNTTFEPDFASMAPAGVTLHAHRIYSKERYPIECQEGFDAVNAGLPEFTQVLARANPAVIAYGITTGSFYRGLAYAEELQWIIEANSEAKAVVPSLALLEALNALKARAIAVVTPYPRWNNEVLGRFLEETPFRVVSLAGDERPVETARTSWLWHQQPAQIVEFARQRCPPDADVLVCPCTAWRSFEVVNELEQVLGKPVVTANQATIWQTFRLLGISVGADRGGSLFRGTCCRRATLDDLRRQVDAAGLYE